MEFLLKYFLYSFEEWKLVWLKRLCPQFPADSAERGTYLGLPNNPNYDLGPVVGSICDTLFIGVPSQTEAKPSFIIFPNPCRDRLLLHFALQGTSVLGLKVFDLKGTVVLQRQIQPADQEIDLTSIESGIYFVQIGNEQFVERQKIVKMQ